MSLREFLALEAAQSVRRIGFESCEVVAAYPSGNVLIVRGGAPCLSMDIRLSPLVYAECPEYWGIEVVGSLPGGFCLGAIKPYVVAVPLTGITGRSGITVLGSRRSERIEVEGGCVPGRFFG